MKICLFLSLPYRPTQPGPSLWLYALRSAFVQTSIPDTGDMQADLMLLPKQVNEMGVVEFVDNGRPEYAPTRLRISKPGMIILCTGYSRTFPFLSGTKMDHTSHPSSYVRGFSKENTRPSGSLGLSDRPEALFRPYQKCKPSYR